MFYTELHCQLLSLLATSEGHRVCFALESVGNLAAEAVVQEGGLWCSLGTCRQFPLYVWEDRAKKQL